MTVSELAEKKTEYRQVYRITDGVYAAFQFCSRDYNPLHTDPAFAASHGFGECVMYGNILNAFVSHFVGMALPVRDVMIQKQELAFHKPCFLGDELTLCAHVDFVSEAVNVLAFKLRFTRNRDGKPETVAKGSVQIGLLRGAETEGGGVIEHSGNRRLLRSWRSHCPQIGIRGRAPDFVYIQQRERKRGKTLRNVSECFLRAG